MEDIGDSQDSIIPVIPLSAASSVLSLQFAGIDVSNLGSSLLPMAFVPPGATSAKGKAAMLAIVKAIHNAENAAGNMAIANSLALSQARGNGYLSENFTKLDIQILSFITHLECGTRRGTFPRT